ncbi:MAG: type I restriction endonuclease subunit R [Chitinophagaceae bacterium]|nr:type I restriction endonuclease subunit R [Chitinophagaceae bacterium]
MSGDYTEDKLIEQTSIQIFQEQLGWDTMNVYQGESFGPDGTLGRNSMAEVILKRELLQALERINPALPLQAYEAAYETLAESFATKPLAEINREKHYLLKEGVPVTYKNDKGEIIRNKKLRVFDFDNPAGSNNHFLAVQQFWVEGKSKRTKRPDIIGFVNGIPLVFIELKAHHRKIKVAYEDNLKDYKATIPHLFHCNAFIILSNGLDSKIGAVTSKFEHFHDWKRIAEDEEGIVSLETILKGTCDKNRLLDILENFILFDDSIGSIIKLVARNHQFIGVNKAIDHLRVQQNRLQHGLIDKEAAQKLGVFWHTQGSGKSYSMVFLCQKINRKLGGSFTFLLVTDRVELDKQIYGTFAGVGATNNKKARATSGDALKELLKTDEKYIFTLIHKFNFDEVITDRDNIIVISDEAHRTQGGTLAMNLRKALPNASFMGFTGTPLFKDDELTRRIFGDYVSVYDFKRSVEDGATVPLYYENRGEKLKLDNPVINDEIRTAIEAVDLDPNQEEKLKKLFAKDYPVLTAEKRLRSIAKDVVQHFLGRGYKGKGMFVAMDKVTAVRMFNYITEEWQLYLQQWRKDIDKLTDQQEAIQQEKDFQWAKDTEIAVVVSHEQNEIEKFEAWGLDIEPHREKINTRDLETEFKDEEHPFRLAIVCAMWITGFDVPSLSTMYIDKPLKSHTLMQAIARANRVHEGKNNGLIVDYIETYKALLQALAIYAIGGNKSTGEDGQEVPVKPLQELINDLDESIAAIESFLEDELSFTLQTLIKAEGTYKIKAIQNGVEAVCTNDETRNKFGVLAREVFKKFKALMPDAAIYQFKAQRDAINAIYDATAEEVEGSDISSIIRQVQQVIDNSIEILNIAAEPNELYGQKVDISSLNFEEIEKEFLKLERKNTLVQSVKDKIEKSLKRMLEQNPLRIDYYEKYEEIIELYNKGKEYATVYEIFQKLKDLYGQMTAEQRRAQVEELTEDELAVFDMLGREKKISDNDKAAVKDTAKKLLERLQVNEFTVERWAEKTQTAAAVRKVINDYLFASLPYPTYEDKDISQKTDVLFHFFRQRYGGWAA